MNTSIPSAPEAEMTIQTPFRSALAPETATPGTAGEAADDFAPVGPRGPAQKLTRPSLSYWQDAWIRLRRNRQALASLAIIAFLVAFTGLGPVLWAVDPAAQDMSRISEGPTLATTAIVSDEAVPYEDLTAPGVPEKPEGEIQGATLEAPATLELLGEPRPEGVRLKWAPVKGAASYQIYRADREGSRGIPIGEVEGGNHVSYQDTFDLVSGRSYYYEVVAKNGEESALGAALSVKLSPNVPLLTAQLLDPRAKAGDTVRLPAHPFGTDALGRDLMARVMHGARVSLFIGSLAPMLSLLLGVLVGGISGYASGRADLWLMRFTDFVLALPFLLFMILFKVAFGAGPGESGIVPMLVAMVLLSWTGPARLVRGQLLQLRESEFVQAARLLGARPGYLIARHLLPNTLGVILVSLTFAIPSAIFTEAFLSFIGMGVVPPTPSWGSLCNDGIQTFLTHPHEFLFPAVFISLTVLAFNLIGDGLRDALDPKMRGQS